MKTRFVISDTHFSHENSWKKFKLADGQPMRPFTSTEEMDETMVDNWNKVVGPHDVVYHLGDVAIAKRGLELVKRLNGKKRLIRGNHDIYKDKDYYEVGFEQIHGVRVFVDQWIMSHIPLHPDSVTERFRFNVHGHLHSNEVMCNPEAISTGINKCSEQALTSPGSVRIIDPRYFCTSVERINYTPISFEELEIRIQERIDQFNHNPS